MFVQLNLRFIPLCGIVGSKTLFSTFFVEFHWWDRWLPLVTYRCCFVSSWKPCPWCIPTRNNPEETYPATWEATNPEKLVTHRKTLSRHSWLFAKYGLLHCLVRTTNNADSVPIWQWTVEWSHSNILSLCLLWKNRTTILLEMAHPTSIFWLCNELQFPGLPSWMTSNGCFEYWRTHWDKTMPHH